ncbi:hypothetical protein MnTg02_02357 [bacterium MnTg02]|nr:hypothetical protein MnTg02_02357 [bacterium MnTg02]
MCAILGKPCLDGFRGRTPAPIAFNDFGNKPQLFRNRFPKTCEMPSFVHEYAVTRIEGVHESRLPGARSRRWVDDDRPGTFEDLFDILKNRRAEFAEFRSPVIGCWSIYCAKNTVRYIGRTGNLQIMAACDT